MKMVPIRTPVIEPIGLKACEKFKRRSELSGFPNCAMNGLEAVSRNERPLAITNRANKKNQYRPTRAAGQNKNVPDAYKVKPVTIPALYPTLLIIRAAGMARKKYPM